LSKLYSVISSVILTTTLQGNRNVPVTITVIIDDFLILVYCLLLLFSIQ